MKEKGLLKQKPSCPVILGLWSNSLHLSVLHAHQMRCLIKISIHSCNNYNLLSFMPHLTPLGDGMSSCLDLTFVV